MGKVQKFLERAAKNGWKIARKIDFPDDQCNYHLVPENGGDGYICVWCKGEKYDAQYCAEPYTA